METGVGNRCSSNGPGVRSDDREPLFDAISAVGGRKNGSRLRRMLGEGARQGVMPRAALLGFVLGSNQCSKSGGIMLGVTPAVPEGRF